MSSTPSSSVGNELKSPSYISDHISNAIQAPYVSRSKPIQTLPPPQNQAVANGAATSHLYSHPLNYSQSTNTPPLQNKANTSFSRFSYMGTDAFNYPSLGHTQGNPSNSKFQSLSQVSSQNLLPQGGYPLSSSAFSLGSEKSGSPGYASSSQQFQGYPSSQTQATSNPYSAQDLDLKGSLPLANTSISPSQRQEYAKQMRYSPSDNEPVKPAEDLTYPHTPKFTNSKTSSAPKSHKFSSSKYSNSVSTDLGHQKPYMCSYDGCSWSFVRQSDLRRHSKSHDAPTFHCPYWKNDPTCHRNGGSFSRLDVLKRHLRLVHYIKDKQKSYAGSDPGWCRSCQKLFSTSKTFISHCDECSSQAAPAEWKSNSSTEPVNTLAE